MVRATCHICGWNVRFPGKHDLELFVSDYHAEDRGVEHAFEGVIARYKETKTHAIYNPRRK